MNGIWNKLPTDCGHASRRRRITFYLKANKIVNITLASMLLHSVNMFKNRIVKHLLRAGYT